MKFEALKHFVVIVQRTIVPPTERSATYIKFDLFCLGVATPSTSHQMRGNNSYAGKVYQLDLSADFARLNVMANSAFYNLKI